MQLLIIFFFFKSGDLTKLQPSQINSVITTTLPISTTNQLANNLIAQPQLTLTNGKLFLERSLPPVASSSFNVIHQTSTNAAATAAAIALTNLQNKCELSQPSSSSSNLIQPTVIVQAPSNSIPVVTSAASTIQSDDMKHMMICPSTTTVVTLNQSDNNEPSTSNNASINSVATGTEISSTISNISAATNSSTTSTAISRPIDLLTSVALAAAAETPTTNTTTSVSSIKSDNEIDCQTNDNFNESTMTVNNEPISSANTIDTEETVSNKRQCELDDLNTDSETKRIKFNDDAAVS